MQKIQLAIPEPCHENWNNMSPTDQGRFCKSCAKEVIDFSMMTDTEVLNYFTIQSNEKICGRTLSSQLNRNITMPVEPKKKLFWYWNYFILFFMFFSKSNFVKAQTKGKVVAVPVNRENCSQTVGSIVAGIEVTNNIRVIKGIVVDENDKPVPFASIRIKGTTAGLSTDKNGLFSIKASKNDVIEISASGFKVTEALLSDQLVLKIRLARTDYGLKGEMVLVSGGIKRTTGKIIKVPDNNNICTKEVVNVFVVKDHETGLPVNNASIVLVKIGDTQTDTVFTDKKGVYKLKRLKKSDGFFIKIFNAGYVTQEFAINGNEFNERKEAWEILLEKKKRIDVRSTVIPKSSEIVTTIRLGGIEKITPPHEMPLFVVDGIIVSNSNDIKPDDILTVTVLRNQAAIAIYGPKGMFGAIVMTSKAKGRVHDTIKISQPIKEASSHTLIYPNPVQQGNSFTIDMQVKETGIHQIQISGLVGQVVFQKQVNAITKEQREMIQPVSNWSAGIYFVSLFDKKGQLISKSSFIVQ